MMASSENQIHGNIDNSVSKQSETEATIEISDSMDTSENVSDFKLPQALEKVLALKTVRAQELGIDPDTVLSPNAERTQVSKAPVVNLVSVDDEDYVEEEEVASQKQKDSKIKRRKKKKKKRQIKSQNPMLKFQDKHSQRDSVVDVDIEYVIEVIDTSDPLYHQFMKIFEKFKLTEGEKENEVGADAGKNTLNEEMFIPMAIRRKPVELGDDNEKDDKLEEKKPKLSKRKLKKLSRMSVAELKQKVNRPELVEIHDVTAKDPVLLLHLKASRNTVPVPRHWCFKCKYLQGKRGIEKPAFELPDFIKRTGIMETRQALQEKYQKTMKAKVRERVRPKLGKIDMDYQKLHDAFFKWQTKRKMTIHGDLYYEGKEFETRLREKKPGDLSEDLRTALGMPTGPHLNKCPPPWLIAMQRYGPPPSYPYLKIPGLTAPIPDGCSFGYHAGGWGKPPIDGTGRLLYGDVFGTQILDNQSHIEKEEIDHTLWGELKTESSEEDEEEEENEYEEDETRLVTPAEGLITPNGFSSIPAGMETPDMIEFRKRKVEVESEGGEAPTLYTILPEKKTERVGAAMMGSTHTYEVAAEIPGCKLKASGTESFPPQGIEVALDPSELEMDTIAMAARYEQTMREQQTQLEEEDLSDMVAEHAALQKSKRKKQQLDSAKPPKKCKEFKF
ncbi:splicing factor 3B subunit 2-like [Parasteatoda tepidariorum]|uniref:splicing factor 3B subunit 2-like n=1 Tax=Parasteatoda tepidariorum TaxID=114398 RepID=UPI00077FC550|nr:splicing factor 3B subunit 2-like [Parasteatoda tepidariorum]